MNTVIKYSLFALLSIVVNIIFQYISFILYHGFLSLYVAMFVGTLAGLIFKYILDKKFIFYHTSKNRQEEGKKFILYSLMGVFTTLIFWGVEIGFDSLFENSNAKYLGAIIGLTMGYIIKYYLDKKFVFRSEV
jgi:putative flippase GtrA